MIRSWFQGNLGSAGIIAWQWLVATVAPEPGTLNYLCTSPLSRTPRCCRTGFPLLGQGVLRQTGKSCDFIGVKKNGPCKIVSVRCEQCANMRENWHTAD